MKRRTLMQMGVAAGAGALNSDPVWLSRSFNALGTTMTLRVAHDSNAQAEEAIAAGEAAVRRVEDQMSLFRDSSALCELNRRGFLRNPEPELLKVLRIAQDVSRRSQGAFDVTVQPLWLAYSAAQQHQTLPDAAEVARARALTGWKDLQISEREIRLARAGMGVTLNGIAPGFAADLIQTRLRAHGVRQALISTGEWASLGKAPLGRDWILGVDNPRQQGSVLARLAMQGRCVATSADDECTFSADHRCHHIIDPRTGYSPPVFSSVTVMAPHCVMADAVTKVIFMSGYESALPLAKAWGVDVLVVEKSGRWQATKGVPLLRG